VPWLWFGEKPEPDGKGTDIMSIRGVSSIDSMRRRVRALARRAVVAPCVLAALIAVSIAFPNETHAQDITYTETGFLTGTLNSVGFTDAAVTLTTVADTANLYSTPYIGGSTFYMVPGTTTIKIAGFSLATFNGPYTFGAISMAGFPSPGDLLVGIGDISNGWTVLGNIQVAPAYDLSTSATYTHGSWGNYETYSTTAGDLVTSNTIGDATFTATVSNVPEPASAMLFGLGTLALAGIRRRRAGRVAAPDA
jgi:hypothetical protein